MPVLIFRLPFPMIRWKASGEISRMERMMFRVNPAMRFRMVSRSSADSNSMPTRARPTRSPV